MQSLYIKPVGEFTYVFYHWNLTKNTAHKPILTVTRVCFYSVYGLPDISEVIYSVDW